MSATIKNKLKQQKKNYPIYSMWLRGKQSPSTFKVVEFKR